MCATIVRRDTADVVRLYLLAKERVAAAGHEAEIVWQQCVARGELELTESRFLREAAWVVLNAGMRESVVRQLWPDFMQAFGGLHLAGDVVARQSKYRQAALTVFAHDGKVEAVIGIARRLEDLGIERIKRILVNDCEAFLTSLPYIGPVTWRHLAKNLGIPVVKNDRHLVRLVRLLDRNDVDSLCREVAEWLGEPVPVVDLVFWRWSTMGGVEQLQS